MAPSEPPVVDYSTTNPHANARDRNHIWRSVTYTLAVTINLLAFFPASTLARNIGDAYAPAAAVILGVPAVVVQLTLSSLALHYLRKHRIPWWRKASKSERALAWLMVFATASLAICATFAFFMPTTHGQG